MQVINDSESVQNTGYKVSELEAVTDVRPTDLFIISQNGKSYQTSYFDFLERIISDLIERVLKFGSMAYEEKEWYAHITHTHDGIYNKCDFYQPPDVDLNCFTATVTNNDGTNKTSNQVAIKSYTVVNEFPPNPKIGTLKFILASKSEIPFENSNFNGWIIPNDNRQLPTATWTEAANGQAFLRQGSNMTIPALNGKFTKSKNVEQRNSYEYFPQQVGCQNHTHTIGPDSTVVSEIKLEVADNFRIPTYTSVLNRNNPQYQHWGSGHEDKPAEFQWQPSTATLNLQSITIPDFETMPESSTDAVKPNSINLFTMIYAGNRKPGSYQTVSQINKEMQEVKVSVILKTIPQLQAVDSSTDNDVFEIARPSGNGKYTSNSITYGTIRQSMTNSLSDTMVHEFDLKDTSGQVISLSSVNDKTNKIWGRADWTNSDHTIFSKRTALKPSEVRQTVVGMPESEYTVKSDVNKLIESGSTILGMQSLADFNIINANGIGTNDADELMKWKIDDKMNDSYYSLDQYGNQMLGVKCKKTGWLTMYGWFADNGDVVPQEAWVGVFGQMCYNSTNNQSNIAWMPIQIQPWVIGEHSSNLQYVGFGFPVRKGLQLKVRTGFNVNGANTAFNEGNHLVLENIQPNTVVGYIIS